MFCFSLILRIAFRNLKTEGDFLKRVEILNSNLNSEVIDILTKISELKFTSFKLEKRLSTIPNAGYGLFVSEGSVKKGQITCFYSGVCFSREDIELLKDTKTDLYQSFETNQYLLRRQDG